jgi:cytochrome c peroxidase
MVKAGIIAFAAASLLLGATATRALTPSDLLQGYEASARRASASFGGFSPERGRTLFQSTHGNDWSCSTCHTQNPATTGKHAKTGKAIAPLAPAANPDRFTSVAEAEKWFKRNCNDVMGRECTAQEKGDVLAYLMQVAPGAAK